MKLSRIRCPSVGVVSFTLAAALALAACDGGGRGAEDAGGSEIEVADGDALSPDDGGQDLGEDGRDGVADQGPDLAADGDAMEIAPDADAADGAPDAADGAPDAATDADAADGAPDAATDADAADGAPDAATDADAADGGADSEIVADAEVDASPCQCASDADCAGVVAADSCQRAACVSCACEVVPTAGLCDDGQPCTDDACVPQPGCPGGGELHGAICLLAAVSDADQPVDTALSRCESSGGAVASTTADGTLSLVLAVAESSCGAGVALWADAGAGAVVIGADGSLQEGAGAARCVVCELPSADYSCSHAATPPKTDIIEICNGVDDDCDGQTDEQDSAPAPGLCDDGDACTTDTCDADGTCSNLAPELLCDDGVDCTADACDPLTGCVNTPDPLVCDDHLACTADACSASEGCQHTPDDALCDDGATCTADACTTDKGCQFTPDDAPCDDGLDCTTDSCEPSVGCVHAPVDAVCDDANPCTIDSCVPGSGCEFAPSQAACDDGDACTSGDTCASGQCAPGAPRVCDDGLPCTADSCDPATGCVAPPEPDCVYAGDMAGYYEGPMEGSGTVSIGPFGTVYWSCVGTARAVIDARLTPGVQSVGEASCAVALNPLSHDPPISAFVPGKATGTISGTTVDATLDVQGVAAMWSGTVVTDAEGVPTGIEGTTEGEVDSDELIKWGVSGVIAQGLSLFAPDKSPYTLTLTLTRVPSLGTCCGPSGCEPSDDYTCNHAGNTFLAEDAGECCEGADCVSVPQSACEALAEHLFVPSTPGACCAPDGCYAATSALCDLVGGVHTKGADCADGNQDGYPDVCGLPPDFGYVEAPGCGLDGDTLTVDVGGVTAFDLVSTWVPSAAGFTSAATITLPTALGDLDLPGGSSVSVGCGDPFTITGQITAPPSFPAWPSLGVETTSPALDVGYAFGYELLAKNLHGPFADGRPYLFAAADTGMRADVGGAVAININEGDFATVALDPTDPAVIVEVGGEALSQGTGKLVKSVGVGLSRGGNLTWRSAVDLYDGSGFKPAQMTGNIWRAGEFGLIPLAGLPANVFIDGEVVVDAGAAVDHVAAILESFVSGDPGALAASLAAAGSSDTATDVLSHLGMAGNVNSLLLEAGPVEIHLASGAFRYSGGTFYFTGEGFSPGAALASGKAGKAFEAFSAITIQETGRAWGFIDANGFRVTVEADLTAGPFSLNNVRLILDSESGIRIEGGSFGLDFGAFLKALQTLMDCDFSAGGATCAIAGFEVASINGGIDDSGFRFEMSAGIPLVGNVDFSALVTEGGSFNLQGRVQTGIPGFQTAEVQVTVEDDGFGVSTSWAQLGQTIFLSGDIGFNGSFLLKGYGGVEILGFQLSGVTATLSSGAGFRLEGSMKMLTQSLTAALDVAKDLGTWTLTGKGKLSVFGYDLASVNATASSASTSISLTGKVDVGPVKADLAGSVTPDHFELTGSSSLSIAGVDLSEAQFTLGSDGLHALGKVDLYITKLSVSGAVEPNGHFALTGSSDTSVGPSGVLSLSLNGTLKHNESGTSLSGSGKLNFLGQTFQSSFIVLPPGGSFFFPAGLFSWTAKVGFEVGFNFLGSGARISGDVITAVAMTPGKSASLSLNFEGKACAKVNVGFAKVEQCKGRKESVSIDGKMKIDFPGLGGKTVDLH